MDSSQGPHIRFAARPQAGLVERIVFFVIGLVILVAAFFFVGIALIAGAILAGVILLRFWWIKRKLRQAQAESFVEGEYRVVESAITDQRTPRE